jgi:hypothetical protein
MSGYNNIQTALSDIQAKLNTSDNTSRKILEAESQRLIDKQTAINEAKFGQNRVIDLNRDQMRRTTAYTKVGIVAVISLGIVLVFRLLGDVIPESVMTLIYVILLSVCLFYGIFVYTDVNGREKTNYNRYDIPAPAINLSDEEKAKRLAAAVKTGDLLAANSLSGNTVCTGQGCCSYEQAYISNSNKCEKCSDPNKPYFVKASNSCDKCPNFYNVKTQSCETTKPSGPDGEYYQIGDDDSKIYGNCPTATPKWDAGTSSCTACPSGQTWRASGGGYKCAA